MDWLQILEQYGIPIVVAGAMFVMVKQQNKYIQDELSKELRESFTRIENIIIGLINQQKKMQIEQKGLEKSYKALVEIIAKLSGNGLKHKFLNMLNSKEDVE